MSDIQEHDMDSYALLYVEAVNGREDAANLHLKLGTKELEACKFMKERLLQYLATKHSISPETHELSVDLAKRKVFIKDLPVAPATPLVAGPAPAAVIQ